MAGLISSEIPEGFDHYVDLTAEFEEPLSARSRSTYRSFPILDASIPTVEKLRSVVEETQHGKTLCSLCSRTWPNWLVCASAVAQAGKG